MDPISYIHVKRWSNWVYWLRKFDVVIDDKKVGRIGNGKEERFEVTPGPHVVELRVSWIFKSQAQSVSLQSEESILLEGGCPISTWQFGLCVVFGFFMGSPKLSLALFGDFTARLLALVSAVAMLAYSVWLYCGRGKFLALNEPKPYP